MIDSIVNISFFKKLSLSRVTFYGIILWIFIFIISDIKIIYGVNFFSVFYIIVCYFSLFVGFIYTKKNIQTRQFIFNESSLKKILYLALVIAIIAFAFRIIDKFYIRGITLSNTTIVNRVILTEKSSSVFGLFGAFLSPFAFIPLFLAFVLKIKDKLLILICGIVFFNLTFENILLGSRFGILMIILLFVLLLIHFKKIRITYIKVFWFFILGMVLILLATKMFLDRTKEFAKTDNVAINHILSNAGYNYTMKPTKEYKEEIINEKNELLKVSKLSKVNIAQYYLHGVFEFSYLYNNYEKDFRWGGYMFSIIPKLSNIVFRTNFNLKEINGSMPRTGIYTTFFGPLYVDFGWLGPFFMFFFGLIQSIIYNKVISGNFKYIPLLLYFFIIDFFMPVINFIVSAQGLYIIISFLVFVFYYKFLMYKKLKRDKLD